MTPHLMLDNAAPAIGWYKKALGGSPASLWIYVEDADALYNRAVIATHKERNIT